MEEANKTVTPASFVCEKCKGTPSMDQIVQSVATYGLISLITDEKAWIGFNCPLCEQPWTNIKKFKREETTQFGLELYNRIASNLGTPVYHSFPYSVHLPVKEPVYVSRYMREIESPVDKLGEEIVYDGEPEEYPDDRRKLYSSYFFGLEAFGPEIAIWWYRDEDIEKLAAYESDTGLRAFPRYRLYDNIYSAIDNFCWQNRLHLDYLKELNLDWPITYLLSYSTKKDLKKAFDFMHILDMSHLQDIPEAITGEIHLIQSSSGWSALPRQTADIISDTYSTSNTVLDHEKISSVVWANFTKDYIQDLLKKFSEMFIDEYIALSKRTDFTYRAVWQLKEKYLSDLKKAIESRPERQKLKQIANEDHRLRVLKAEKCFPGVKIISQNIEIDDLKIKISKLSKVSTERKIILLLGERGTGKGFFAKAIHEASGRKGKFVKFDCGDKQETLFKSELFGHVKGAFTGADRDRKGAIEKAENGTIFIDEIGNLSLSLQAAMLGFLQDWEFQPVGSEKTKDVNAMVVLATNMDLEAEIENGNFRADLHDRIRFVNRKIPPLRNRKDDIPILFDHFINKHDSQGNKDPSFEKITATSDCIKALIDFDWPGNVRELEGVVIGIFDNREEEDRSPIDVSDLPDSLFSISASKDQVDPKSNKLSHPSKNKYNHLPKDDSILIEHEQDGMKRKDVAQKYGVDQATVIRRYSNIRKKAQI